MLLLPHRCSLVPCEDRAQMVHFDDPGVPPHALAAQRTSSLPEGAAHHDRHRFGRLLIELLLWQGVREPLRYLECTRFTGGWPTR